MWQLWVHCNLKPPETRQPFPAYKITMPWQVWCRRTYPLLYYSDFAADTLHVTSDPVTLNFDLWLWTYAAYCPWRDETEKLCTKFEGSRAIRGAVIAISVFDLMTLNIVLCVALDSGIICTKFDLRQLIPAWIIAFLMLILYVMLWPWPLTHWPWRFVVHQTSCDQSLYKIWAKSSNPG